jgi:hypothetical protein
MRKEKASDRQGTNEVQRSTIRNGVAVARQTGASQTTLMQRTAARSPCATPRLQTKDGSGARRSRAHPKTLAILVLGVLALFSVGAEKGETGSEVPAFGEFLVIPERNMFSSRRGVGRNGAETGQEWRSATPATPTSIEVVGIVKTNGPQSSIAVMTDQGRYLLGRVGDTVGGMLITDIRTSKVFFETPEGTRIVQLQPGMIRGGVVMPEAPGTPPDLLPARGRLASSAGRRLPLDAADIRGLARRLPLVTHVDGGEVKGLRLTRDIMGLKEGDRLTQVGGQSLCTRRPKQRLWQIASKYRQYGKEMPEIPVVVERDDGTLEFVLVPPS